MSEPIPSLLDNDQLNETERQFIELFERRSPSSDDDGALASAELEPEDGTPASTSGTAAPGAPAPVEGPDGAPASAPSTQEPEATPPATPPATGEVQPEPEGEGAPQSPAPFTFAGRDYSPEELTEAVRTREWFSRLTDDHVRAIDAIMSGQYRLVPAEASTQPATTQATGSGPAAEPAPATPPASPPPEAAGEWLDPRAEAEINRLRQQQAELTQSLTNLQQTLQSSVTPLVQTQQQQQQQAHLDAIDRGTNAFTEKYHLDPSAVEQIQAAVVQAGILPSTVSRHGGDVEAAVVNALDMMFWTTPQFRDQYLQSRTAAEQAELQRQQQDNQVKQQRLTALSASGGSVPRREPVPSDRDGRFAAMVDVIAQAQNGQ